MTTLSRTLSRLLASGLAAPAALLMPVWASPATAQEGDTAAAADRAAATASEVRAAIRAIDPTTGGPSIVVDPSLPLPYGAELAPEDEPGAELLPLLPDAPGIDPPLREPAPVAERGPAARMIANTVVQPLPENGFEPRPQPASEPAPELAGIADEDPFVIRSILPIAGTIRYGEWFWDESGAPAEGPLVITVDLDARVISAFRGGHEIGTAVALLGTRKHPTPLGTFPILTKEKDNISEKYNNAPMPWTLRLTWDGIAIHGSPVINGYASHGCIGVPDPFARKLFEAAGRGDKVVITRGKYVEVGDRLLS